MLNQIVTIKIYSVEFLLQQSNFKIKYLVVVVFSDTGNYGSC